MLTFLTAILPDWSSPPLPSPPQCLVQSLASLNTVSWNQSHMQTVPYLFHSVSSLKIQISPSTYIDWVVICPEISVLKFFPHFGPALQAIPLCSIGLHFGVWVECFNRQGKEAVGNWKIHKSYLCQQVATSTPHNRCQEGESLVSQPWCPWKQGKKHFQMLGHQETAPSSPLNF